MSRDGVLVNTSRTALAFPVLPPAHDGIGDYVGRLAAKLSEDEPCCVFTQAGSFDSIPGVDIYPAQTALEADGGLLSLIEQHPVDRLIVQYNPFSYGRWGLNLSLPTAIKRLRRRFPQLQIGLMVHESIVPARDWKRRLMRTWQSYQLRELGAASDVIFFSISAWVEQYGPWFPGKPIIHAPVGSNIPRIAVSNADAKAHFGLPPDALVIGAFGSDHESRMWDLTVEAAEAIVARNPKTVLVYAGSAEHRLRELVRNVPLLALGRLPADQLSIALSAMDLFLSPFKYGISSRKGSAIVGLQHEVATLTTNGPQTDALFVDSGIGLTDANDPDSFVSLAVRIATSKDDRCAMASAGARLYRDVFSWDRVASVFREAFDASEWRQ